MHNHLCVYLILVYTMKRADLIGPDKFMVSVNETFNTNEISFIPRDQFTVSQDKICASKCSRNDACESAVYDSLRKICFIYSSLFNGFNFAKSNGPVKFFSKISIKKNIF